jgi:hypothetical protein
MLKKIALVAAAIALISAAAVATAGNVGSTYKQITDSYFTGLGINFKPSNNVQVMMIDDAATSPQLYTICSKNTAGDRVYATSNLSTNIYYKSVNDDSTNIIPGKDMTTIASTVMGGINAGESLNWGTWHAQ